jgi:serine/threonine-protein kinase RsbW
LTALAEGTGRFELSFTSVRQNLALIRALVSRAATEGQLDAAIRDDLQLAIEEACVNLIDHGYPPQRPGPIDVAIEVENDRVTVVISDRAAPFDPKFAPAPDLDSDWSDRSIGGLGLHLIRNVMDELNYDSLPGGGNRLTLTKYRTIAREAHGNRHQEPR